MGKFKELAQNNKSVIKAHYNSHLKKNHLNQLSLNGNNEEIFDKLKNKFEQEHSEKKTDEKESIKNAGYVLAQLITKNNRPYTKGKFIILCIISV